MNKYIILGLVISTYILSSVGIELLPLITIVNLSAETCTKLNLIYLNIAYSYFAGFIIYIFTFVIPYYSRRKSNIEYVNQLIEDFYFGILGNFDYYYIRNNVELTETNDKILFEEVKEKFIQTHGEVIYKFYRDTIEYKYDEHLRQINLIIDKFINSILPYYEYLTEKQMQIITEIRKNKFSEYVDFYLIYKIHKTEEDVTLFKTFLKIKLFAEKLYKTLDTNNKKKAIKKIIS